LQENIVTFRKLFLKPTNTIRPENTIITVKALSSLWSQGYSNKMDKMVNIKYNVNVDVERGKLIPQSLAARNP